MGKCLFHFEEFLVSYELRHSLDGGRNGVRGKRVRAGSEMVLPLLFACFQPVIFRLHGYLKPKLSDFHNFYGEQGC